jgi:hypothetical protein
MDLHSGQSVRRHTLVDHKEPIGVASKRGTLSGTQGNSSKGAPRRTQWKLNANMIIKKLESNRTFQLGSYFDVEGLSIFADLSRYGLSERKQLELFSLETRRLADAVNSGKSACLQ